MIKMQLRNLVLAFVVSAATPCFSSMIAYGQSTQITGNQGWLGSLGMDFHVDQTIVVTEIGAFSSKAFSQTTASPSTTLNVGIFKIFDYTSIFGAPIPNTQFSFIPGTGYAVRDNWLFHTINVVLDPGFYTIVAQGYNGSEMNGNLEGNSALTPSTEDNSGLISFGGTALYGPEAAPSDFPSIVDGGPSNRYYAGNFQFVAAVPEPVSILLIGFGLMGIALLSRWQQQR